PRHRLVPRADRVTMRLADGSSNLGLRGTSGMSSTKSLKYRLAIIIPLVLLAEVGVAVLVWVAARGGWGDQFFTSPGPMQVLASEDELWVFTEINGLVRVKHPIFEERVRHIAREQYAVRFDGNTWYPAI